MSSPVVDCRPLFEEKVLGLMDDLYGAALRLAKNREDAEDLVAEAVTRAWAARRALKDMERFRPWIFRILTNTFMSEVPKTIGPAVTEGPGCRFRRGHERVLAFCQTPSALPSVVEQSRERILK